jgi:hypothetical protein
MIKAMDENRDPTQCALFYVALGKRKLWQQLWKTPAAANHPEQAAMSKFLSHDFNEDRWRQAALKNAFVLLGKQRFEYAAAFFLIGGSIKDAVCVCLKQLSDPQLAYVVYRCFVEGQLMQGKEDSSCMNMIMDAILESAIKNEDRWVISWHWWLEKRWYASAWSLLLPFRTIRTLLNDSELLEEVHMLYSTQSYASTGRTSSYQPKLKSQSVLMTTSDSEDSTKLPQIDEESLHLWTLFLYLAQFLKRTRRILLPLPPSPGNFRRIIEAPTVEEDEDVDVMWWKTVEKALSLGLQWTTLDILVAGMPQDLLSVSLESKIVVRKKRIDHHRRLSIAGLPNGLVNQQQGLDHHPGVKVIAQKQPSLFDDEPPKPILLFDDPPAPKPMSLFDDEPPKPILLFDDSPAPKPMSLFDDEPPKPILLFDDPPAPKSMSLFDDEPPKPISLFDDEPTQKPLSLFDDETSKTISSLDGEKNSSNLVSTSTDESTLGKSLGYIADEQENAPSPRELLLRRLKSAAIDDLKNRLRKLFLMVCQVIRITNLHIYLMNIHCLDHVN